MNSRWAAAILLAATLASGCLASAPAATDAPHGSTPAPGQTHEAAPLIPGIPLAPIQATQVSSGSEPVIVADRNGKYLWIGDTSGGHWSDNNGTSWNQMGNYAGGSDIAVVDGWALAQDDAGNLYAGVLRANRVDVVRSADGGKTWNQVGYAAGVSGTADRPWIAAKGDGEVALFYFDAPAVLTGFAEHCARSTDGGMTFVDRDPLAVLPPTGGSAFYDAAGHLFFSSNSGTLHRFDSTCIAGSSSIPMASGTGVDNMIQATADGTDLYMASATGASASITLFGSHGAASSKKLVVSSPDLKSNTYAAVSARNGQVAVAWYGSTTPGDPSAAGYSGDFNTYLAVVDGFWDASPRITRYQLSSAPNHHGQICMGGVGCDLSGSTARGLLDYFKLDYDIWGGIHVAFVDDADGASKVLYAHVPPARPPPPPGPQSPVASFTVRVTDRTASTDASRSASPARSPLSFRWDWGDGTSGSGTRANHTYAQFGNYDIKLTVTDNAGRAGTHTTRIVVNGQSVGPPVAAWDAEPAEPAAGESVTFRDRSTAQGAIATAAWDFGDGETAAGAVATHTFTAPGNYTVRLDVTDERGASDSLARDIVVGEAGTTTTTPPASRAAGMPEALFVLALSLTLAGTRRRP